MTETSASLPAIGFNAVQFDATGHASMRDPDQPLRFQFRYRGMAFHAKVEFSDTENARLCLTGILGSVPFTIESPELRRAVLPLIVLANNKIPNRIKIIENRHVVYTDEVILALPITPIGTIEAITQMIAKVRPLILFFQTVLSTSRA
ncbi:MAG: hypothetical protein O2912_08500 [Proteobacteria bacterium]|nr:hypothetical protein [Pseudomonadota bacterium]